MTIQALFGLSVAMSFIAWGIVAWLFVWPRLRVMPRDDALLPLVVPHAFRFVGLSFLVPGVLGMTMLFGAMLAALTTVYDKESGVMRMMVIAPMPHAWIVIAKVVSAAAAALLQAILLLVLLVALGYAGRGTEWGLLAAALAATSLACAGVGMLTAAFSRSLDNFAGIMNFVIFPVFFLSGSLYPVRDLPPALGWIATANPYTYGVDLLKHALLPGAGSADFGIGLDLAVLALATAVTVAVASWRFSRESAYEPMIHVLADRAK